MVVQMFEHLINEFPIVNQPLSAKYVKSFAYPTFKERIPKIIDGIVKRLNDLEHVKQIGDEAVDEVEIIKQKIMNIRKSMVTDGDILPVDSNSGLPPQTISVYNGMIEERKKDNNGNPPTWFQTEWLFAECYVYFKLHDILRSSKSFQQYDPFSAVKIESLQLSSSAIRILAGMLVETKGKNVPTGPEKQELFEFYAKCSLWGNKADLSLSDGKAVGADDSYFSCFHEMDSCILVNDLNCAYEVLKNNDKTIEYIFDNAGYELVNDLVFADFLVWSGIAKKVVFHGKNMPWFVSDVTMTDFITTFDLLETKIKDENISTLVNSWREYLDNGKWEMKCEPFWTFPSDYSRMSSEAPELYKKLSQSDLCIFKGDLNYRKLMGDIYWEPTTSFQCALRGFEPTNVLALRTIKADTISGLPKGVAEKLNATETNWMITGKYALIQVLRK